MKENIIRNAEGEQMNVNVVRFFRLNGIEYLIFSLNEIDEGGYVKLYVSKISDDIGKTIEDDVEWNLIKDTIKTVIKSNKDNLPLPITDLNDSRVNNIQILDQKIFKLNDSLLQLLTANKKEEISVQINPQVSLQDFVSNFSSEWEVQPETHVMPQAPAVDMHNPLPTEMVIQGNEEYITKSAPDEFNVNVQSSNVEYGLDYKTLYDNELKKNEELLREVEKYRDIIDRLKNILNDNI